MKKIVSLLLALICIVCALGSVGCSKYVSRYYAIAFVHSNESDSAFMEFYSFEGTMVFRMRAADASGKLRFSAKLEDGSAKVYYDCGGTKTELFTLHAGDEIDSSVDLGRTGTVYVIIETDGECRNGSLHFEIG